MKSPDERMKIQRTCATLSASTPQGVSVENLCAPGYYCDVGTKYCRPSGLPGMTCKFDAQCLPGMTCDNGLCVIMRLAGDTCESDDDCAFHKGSCKGKTCLGLPLGAACQLGENTCDKKLVCSFNLTSPGNSGVCSKMLYPPKECQPSSSDNGVCAPGISACMESAAGAGDWKCVLKLSMPSKPAVGSFCGEELYSVNGASIGESRSSTTRAACVQDIECNLGMCRQLCSTGSDPFSSACVCV